VQQCTGDMKRLFFASSRDGLGLHILEYLISQLEIILENLELLFESHKYSARCTYRNIISFLTCTAAQHACMYTYICIFKIR
jgi:hypothetical protein